MKRHGFTVLLLTALVNFSTVGVLAGVAPGTYFPTADSWNSANAPGSSHLANGSGVPYCTVNADASIDCGAYTLGGVGHTNADIVLSAVYSADILCNNPAGGKNRNNDIEPHTTTFGVSNAINVKSSKNGQLAVPARHVEPTTSGNPCPNPNWIPEFTNLQVVSFSYTLTFAGFADPYITIAQP